MFAAMVSATATKIFMARVRIARACAGSLAAPSKRVALVSCLLLHAATAYPARAAEAADKAHAPVIVFLTDYGTLDDAVAICKGVMLSIAPEARIVDLTHHVTPYSIAEGARFLARTAPYFPAGTIFVGVVDPGVGTARRAVIAKSRRGQYFVVPDNGLLTYVEDGDGIESARVITNPAWRWPGPVSATFHGRDIFAPAGAHLARGEDWASSGAPIAHLVRLASQSARIGASGISGRVVALDGPFGNLVTNIKGDMLQELGVRVGDQLRIKVGALQLTVPYVTTFADVPIGAPLLYIDSSGLLSVAINQGNFGKVHDISPPVELNVLRK